MTKPRRIAGRLIARLQPPTGWPQRRLNGLFTQMPSNPALAAALRAVGSTEDQR